MSRSVWRLTWPDKKVEEVLRDADGFDVIANRSTALVRKGGRSSFIELADLRGAQNDVPPAMPAGRALTIPTLPATIDVRAEWKQIYHETWRLQRDLFYAANYNGLDLAKAEATYAPFVAGLGSRSDLTYLMREMLTNLSVSHLAVNDPPPDDAAGGRGGGRGRGGGGAVATGSRVVALECSAWMSRSIMIGTRSRAFIGVTFGSADQQARWRNPAWTSARVSIFARSTDTI